MKLMNPKDQALTHLNSPNCEKFSHPKIPIKQLVKLYRLPCHVAIAIVCAFQAWLIFLCPFRDKISPFLDSITVELLVEEQAKKNIFRKIIMGLLINRIILN